MLSISEGERGTFRSLEELGQRHPCRGFVGGLCDRAPEQRFGNLNVHCIGGLQVEHRKRETIIMIGDRSPRSGACARP